MSQLDPQTAVSPESSPADAPSARASSPRAIAASRANGAKSHGPTTPAGLAACAATSGNLRHGMLAQTVVLATESRARFEALVDSFIAEHRPLTTSEYSLIETMAICRWRKFRAACFQKTDLDLEIKRQQQAASGPLTPAVAATLAWRSLNEKSNTLTTATRLEAAYDRQFNRALRDLTQLIDSRKDDVIADTSTAPLSLWDDSSITFDQQSPEK